MRRANGMGTVAKLPGNRRKPYAVKITTGWSEKGTQKYKYLSYHRTYREALQALNEYIDDPFSLSGMTFEELWDKWLPLQDDKSQGTITNYKVAWTHLEPIHDMQLKNLDRIALQRFYDELHGTVNVAANVKKTLNLMITYAVKRGYLPLSALHLHEVVEIPTTPPNRTVDREIISQNDISMLWDMSEHNVTARSILILLYTGLRFSELYRLDPADIYDDHFDITKAKTAAGVRTVPICDKIRHLFPFEPLPQYQTYLDHFHMVLPDHNVHDTRHTFITNLTEKGVDPRIIKTIVGHSQKKDITATYTHISLSKMMEAVNLL